MQDLKAERQFYQELFTEKPDNEHITFGYDELYDLAFREPPAGLVLDLGCGTGSHTIRLARRGYRVVGAELTLQGCRSAKQRLEKEGFQAMLVCADAERLPFRTGAFHTVWAALLLHHFPVLDRLPEEIRRVAQKRFVTFEPNSGNLLTWLVFNVINPVWRIHSATKNQRSLSPDETRRMFQKLGFERFSVHFVDRGWNDAGSVVRRTYRAVTAMLPERFRANKFLLTAELPTR